MISRFNSFLSSTKQPAQPDTSKPSPYTQAIDLAKSRSTSAMKIKELWKNPSHEKVMTKADEKRFLI